MLHKALQNKWARVLIAVFATFLYALGVNLFVVPMGLYSGGVVGLSQIIRTLLAQAVELPAGVDIAGILYFLINIPVLYLAWRDLGRAFLIRTLICVGASSLFLSVIQSPAVPILDDPLASCLVGGILCGFALGLALTCGCSTGGLDVVGLCLTKRGSRFTVGRFSLGFNIVLYVACALLFDIQTAIYSVIYTVFCSLFIDRGHQQNINVQVLIFTRDADPELPRSIMSRLGRGVTYWEGKGAYTESDMRVLCVCVSKFEVAELQETVRELDPHAFFIVQEGVASAAIFSERDLVNHFRFSPKTLCTLGISFCLFNYFENHPCFLKHSRMFYCVFLSIVIALPQSFIMPQQCSSPEDTRHEKVPQRINNHQTPMRCGGIFSCLTSILKNLI